jgi:hypothetical protein
MRHRRRVWSGKQTGKAPPIHQSVDLPRHCRKISPSMAAQIIDAQTECGRKFDAMKLAFFIFVQNPNSAMPCLFLKQQHEILKINPNLR